MTGTFAEYTIVYQSQVVKLPANMPMNQASLLGCGVVTGFGAVVNRTNAGVFNSCVIIGCGGVGLNSIQGAAICGAYPIIAVDIADSKLEAARVFGATHMVNSASRDAVEAVKEITNGKGADYVYVTVGSCDAIQKGLLMSGTRGTTVIVGVPKAGSTFSFTAFDFLWDEKTLTASLMGTTDLQTQVPKLVELYQAGVLKLDELITDRYPLEEINEAIESVKRGEALRNVIVFE
jgi:Zn-dependent alcohol dehydrogenase